MTVFLIIVAIMVVLTGGVLALTQTVSFKKSLREAEAERVANSIQAASMKAKRDMNRAANQEWRNVIDD